MLTPTDAWKATHARHTPTHAQASCGGMLHLHTPKPQQQTATTPHAVKQPAQCDFTMSRQKQRSWSLTKTSCKGNTTSHPTAQVLLKHRLHPHTQQSGARTWQCPTPAPQGTAAHAHPTVACMQTHKTRQKRCTAGSRPAVNEIRHGVLNCTSRHGLLHRGPAPACHTFSQAA